MSRVRRADRQLETPGSQRQRLREQLAVHDKMYLVCCLMDGEIWWVFDGKPFQIGGVEEAIPFAPDETIQILKQSHLLHLPMSAVTILVPEDESERGDGWYWTQLKKYGDRDAEGFPVVPEFVGYPHKRTG